MVSSTPRPYFTPGKDPVPILQEAGWAPGPVWRGGKSRRHRDSIPDRPARSQSLYTLSYPAHISIYIRNLQYTFKITALCLCTQVHILERLWLALSLSPSLSLSHPVYATRAAFHYTEFAGECHLFIAL